MKQHELRGCHKCIARELAPMEKQKKNIICGTGSSLLWQPHLASNGIVQSGEALREHSQVVLHLGFLILLFADLFVDFLAFIAQILNTCLLCRGDEGRGFSSVVCGKQLGVVGGRRRSLCTQTLSRGCEPLHPRNDTEMTTRVHAPPPPRSRCGLWSLLGNGFRSGR